MRYTPQRGPFVFTEKDGVALDAHHIYRDFHAAQKRAGFRHRIRFHDLRHTFASHFMMKGGNIYDLQKILGHTTIGMTERYAHLSPTHLEDAIQVVNCGSGISEASDDPKKQMLVAVGSAT